MKRLFSLLLVAVLIVTSMSVVAFAAGGSANASVYSSQDVKPGQTVTLDVTVSGVYSNYELTMSVSDGLTIKAITGVTANASNGMVAYSSGVNVTSSTFQVTVEVSADAKPGEYYVTATPTYGSMIVPVEEDVEDGVVDGRVRISLGADSATLTINCEHDWTAWTETRKATCKQTGERTRTCNLCGEVETETIPKTQHSWNAWETVKEATCTEDGLRTRTCSICGEVEEEVIEAGHAWGAWKVTKEATCAAKGVESRTCSKCGEVETRVIDKLPHTFNQCEGDYEKDATHHWHECSVCGERCEHNGEHVARTYWELSEDGKVEQLLCEICGYVMDEKPVVEPIDPEPGTGDITGQVAFGSAAILAVLAALAYVVMKRKAIK